MSKAIRIAISLSLVLCLALGVAMLMVACNDKSDQNGDETYTVSIAGIDDEQVLETLKVRLDKEDGSPAADAIRLTDGKAQFTLAAGKYKVAVQFNVLFSDRYEQVEDVFVDSEHKEVTVTFRLKGSSGGDNDNVDYEITVLKADGSPAAGYSFAICELGGFCLTPANTDAEGKVVFNAPATDYEVHYQKSDNSEAASEGFDNTRWHLSATKRSITVEFEPVQQYSIIVKYANGNGAEGMQLSLTRSTTYVDSSDVSSTIDTSLTVNGVTGSDGVATISTIAADYNVLILNTPANYEYDTGLVVEASSPSLELTLTELGTSHTNPRSVVAGRDYTVTVSASSPSIPANGGEENIPAISAHHGYWYSFNPQNKGGYYKVTSSGSYQTTTGQTKPVDTFIKQYTYMLGGYFNASGPIGAMDNAAAENVHFSYEFLIDPEYLGGEDNGNIFLFSVGVADDNCFGEAVDGKVSFTIKFELLKDYVPTTTQTETVQATQVVSAPYVKPTGATWQWISNTDVAGEQLVLSDGYYHYLSADGPAVFVNFFERNTQDSNMDKKLGDCINLAFQEEGSDALPPNMVYSTNQPDAEGVITKYDLTNFFKAYADAAQSNGGVTYLTQELMLALNEYAWVNGNAQSLGWDKESTCAAFACGYYESEYRVPEGSGSEDEPYYLSSFGKYEITVAASSTAYLRSDIRLGRFAISFDSDDFTLGYSGNNLDKGEHIISGERSGASFTFVNKTSQQVTLHFEVNAPEGSEQRPYELIYGNNSIELDEKIDEVYVRYTQSGTDLMKISIDNETAFLDSPVGYIDTIEGVGSALFECVGGMEYVFVLAVSGGGTYHINIDRSNSSAKIPVGVGDKDDPYVISEDGYYAVQLTADERTKYFSFQAEEAGEWRVLITNPGASIMFNGNDINNNNGASTSVGDDLAKAALSITITEAGTYYLTMGAADDTVSIYYFYFEKLS